ncbi:unnamed protein product, partial [Chrysoparadoxa australica]
GEARVSLTDLSAGEEVIRKVNIVNEVGAEAGSMRVTVRWKKPLKLVTDVGPSGLSGVDVEELISRFSPHKDGQVRWVEFLRYADPPP